MNYSFQCILTFQNNKTRQILEEMDQKGKINCSIRDVNSSPFSTDKSELCCVFSVRVKLTSVAVSCHYAAFTLAVTLL